MYPSESSIFIQNSFGKFENRLFQILRRAFGRRPRPGDDRSTILVELRLTPSRSGYEFDVGFPANSPAALLHCMFPQR